MEGAVFAFSRDGAELACRIALWLQEQQWQVQVFTPAAYAGCNPAIEPLDGSLSQVCADQFSRCGLLIFVGAAGIAVRAIAPSVRSKVTDPAVLSLDDQGTFVIPLLSGHIGGANAWARHLAAAIGAVPVVTTATDRRGLFAIDEWAARQGLTLSSMTAAKHIAAAFVGSRSVGFCTAFPVEGSLPPLVEWRDQGALGFTVTCEAAAGPFEETLCLWPRLLHIGIGCRKGTAAPILAEAVHTALTEAGIAEASVAALASIDLKAKEEGLLALAQSRGWPFHCYTAAALQNVEGDFSASSFVRTVTGVDNVCERAAVLSSGGKLIYKKHIIGGVTVALAAAPYVCRF